MMDKSILCSSIGQVGIPDPHGMLYSPAEDGQSKVIQNVHNLYGRISKYPNHQLSD
jgi:hypothetical protein